MEFIALVLLGILGFSNAQNFYVVTPSTWRLNTDEVIGIAVDHNSRVTANIEVRDHPQNGKVIFARDYSLNPGTPQKVKIKLDIKEFQQEFLNSPGSQKFVLLKVKVNNERKEMLIPVTKKYGYVIIQSDKPLYTPRETASFRIIPLTEEGTPSSEPFLFEIKNPEGIVVEQKTFGRRKMEYYYGTYNYDFPKYPSLGSWTAVARYGNNFELNSTLSFELYEYVLPTFIVNITAPHVITPNDEYIIVKVGAKHSYGENVEGIASFRFGIRKEHSDRVMYFWSNRIPSHLRDGLAETGITTDELKIRADIGWFPRIEGSAFVVEVTVVDDATGNKVVETNANGIFSKAPYLISLKRCLSDFKPGLTTVFEADITYLNGKPAAGVPTKLTARADNRQSLNVLDRSPKSDEYGRVSFEIFTEEKHKEITLTLVTDEMKYTSQAIGICTQKAFKSRHASYIAISRSGPSVQQINDPFQRDIYLEPRHLKDIYYLVLARGRIQKFEKLYEGAHRVKKVSFPVTHEMVPNFRILVFAQNGNELLADSLKIDVEKACSPEAQVTLETQFKELEPGSGGKIIMKGRKNTHVGLFGVDKTVYAMSRSDILRREKILDELGSHDLGCGSGGGLDVKSVLGNAGIMLITKTYASTHSDTCVAIKRKKRSTTENILNRYDGDERVCCGLGLKADKYDRICEDRQWTISVELDALHDNCSKVFFECCSEGEEKKVSGTVALGRSGSGRNFDVVVLLDDEKIEQLERTATVRRDFKQTFINTNYKIGPNNMTEEDISLPHSITTWIIQAISVSPTHGVCVADPKTVVTFKKVFLHINSPYSIKQYEQVEIQATLFNYGSKNISAYVYMHENRGICTQTRSDGKNEKKLIYVNAESAEMVNFPILPLSVDTFTVKFVAAVIGGESDVVEKKLHVVPRGIRKYEAPVIKLDPTNRQGRSTESVTKSRYTDYIDFSRNLQIITINLEPPIGTIAGTEKWTITATGDAVGPVVETSLKNPDHLLQLPSGCGEQNMIRLAPTIFTLKYLTSVDKLTPERREKAFKFIRSGYSNELKFKKADGSYSVWAHTPPSTWLTAFVMKVFCQGTKFIPLDDNVISSGIEWLRSNQQPDGSYSEGSPLIHKDMMGGVNGVISMTAFALISLEECKNEQEHLLEAREKARKYLETYHSTVDSPLPAAIVAYALALTNSTEKLSANTKLLSMGKRDFDKNYMYWKTKHSAQDIETAGYALLTQLQLNNLHKANSIVNWLNTKQLKSGEFKSTQDTVVALQALSEYAARAPNAMVDLVLEITLSRDKDFKKVFRFNNNNAMEPQSITDDNAKGTLFVRTTGTGVGTLAVELQYNILKPEEEICKFHIKETITEIKGNAPEVKRILDALNRPIVRRKKRQAVGNAKEDEKLVYNMDICIRYKGNDPAGMSIADIGIFSGFKVFEEDLKTLLRDEMRPIRRYEKSKRNIVFYLNWVPETEDFCFSFHIIREFVVGNTQSSVMKVYTYYDPDEVCVKFYSPGNQTALIRKVCPDEDCHCAEGGCPRTTFKPEILNIKDISDRRDKMKDVLCEEYNYIWVGHFDSRLPQDPQYKILPFKIIDVIKGGLEEKSKIINQTRVLRANGYCETADILAGAKYIIMGKDPENENVKNYFLDKGSLIYEWTTKDLAPNKDLHSDIERVIKTLRDEGCG